MNPSNGVSDGSYVTATTLGCRSKSFTMAYARNGRATGDDLDATARLDWDAEELC
jgi:hypothetical protein